MNVIAYRTFTVIVANTNTTIAYYPHYPSKNWKYYILIRFCISTFFVYLIRCFNGARCIDGVDQYECSCPEGYFGTNCECPPEAVDDPSLCIDVNASVSWDLPPKEVLDLWTTTFGYDEDTTLPPGNENAAH